MISAQSSNSETAQINRQEVGRKIRYAIVGLGWFTQDAALPAFAHSENSEIVALVSDDPVKLTELSRLYPEVQRTYSYQNYDSCLSSGLIDAVYIALPNHLHYEYTVRALNRGIHVLCEKPMANTVEECEAMLQAAELNHTKLMIAYRLHLEAANLEAIEVVQSGQIGEPRLFNSIFTQQVAQNNIRLQKRTGGGTLNDVGIYCINASRYLFQDEPIAVFATSASKPEPRFNEVAEMTTAILRFPHDRIATFSTSFGASIVSTYQIIGTKGDLRVDPAYPWQGSLTHYLTVEGTTQKRTFEPHDQVAAEFTYFSDCILQDKEPEPSGREGLNDMRIIEALGRSIKTGSFVEVKHLDRQHPRPTVDQIIHCPPVTQKPQLVHASDPAPKFRF